MASIISKRDTDYKAGTGVKVGLKTGTALGKRLEEFGYKDGDQFEIEKPTKTNNTITISSKKSETIHMSGPDGYIFKIVASKSAIESTFSNIRGGVTKKAVDATKFEVDIINEIQRRNNKSEFPGANDNPTASDLAARVVDNLESKYGKFKEAFPVSGDNKPSNLTDVYREFGVRSGEPKTDFAIKKGRVSYCSVKKKEGAQYASAQHNELSAVIQATLRDTPRQKKFAKRVASIVKQTMAKENFYDLRSKIDDFDKVIGRVLGFNPSKPSSEDIKAIQELFDESGLDVQISNEISNFMTSAETQKILFTELITGKNRFTKKEFSPTHMFAWGGTDGDVYYADIFQHIDDLFKKGGFKFRISDRGTGRGGAFRLEPKYLKENFQMNKEEFHMYSELVEEFDYEMDQMLNESIRGRLKSFGSAAKDKVKKALDFLVKAAKKVFSFVAVLISKGMGKLANIFGFRFEARYAI